MRKVILTVILVVILILTILCVSNGVAGPIKIYSYSEISQKNSETTKKLNELNTLKNTEYRTAEEELKTAVTNYNSTYNLYEETASTKTDEENESALYGKDYDLEYLWIVLGNYATDNNCELTIEVSKQDENSDQSYSLCDLKFSVVGSYSSTIDFIEDITNDTELHFVPENLKMYSEYREVNLLQNANSETETEKTNKLILVTEFYQTNIPITQETLLKAETQEDAIVIEDDTEITNTVTTSDDTNETDDSTN